MKFFREHGIELLLIAVMAIGAGVLAFIVLSRMETQ